MKQLIVISLCAGLCFVPAGIVGYLNRPHTPPLEMPTLTMRGPISAPQPKEAEINAVEIPAKSKVIYRKPKEENKTFVCRKVELLSGGDVEYCDWF